MRYIYRVWQFWQALDAAPTKEELALARSVLSPPLLALFLQLQASEQAHSLRLARRLIERGENHPDLLVAALLHDVGKSCYPLRLWQRVLIVLCRRILPAASERWGQGDPKSWRKPFVVAAQHPAWGAHLAREAGASPLAVSIIQSHQDPILNNPVTLQERLLSCLQIVDDEN